MRLSKWIMVALARNALRAAWKTGGLLLLLTAFSGVATADMSWDVPEVVPEIDPGSIVSALALLGGCMLWQVDRLRQR